MRKTLQLILLFIICGASAQDNKEEFLLNQKKFFQDGEDALKKSNLIQALRNFHWVYSYNLNTGLEIISKKRIDSLLPIFQKKQIEKWKGKWKLKHRETTDLFEYECIEINDNQILFYEKGNSSSPSRIEEIKFAAQNRKEILPSFSSLEFKNTEIWEFRIEVKNNKELFFPEMIRDSTGVRYMLLDERQIITDPVERKKALAKEIRTYYLRKE